MSIRGTVTELVSLGTTVRVVMDCGFTLTSVITRHALEELSLAPGVRVAAFFKATRHQVLYIKKAPP